MTTRVTRSTTRSLSTSTSPSPSPSTRPIITPPVSTFLTSFPQRKRKLERTNDEKATITVRKQKIVATQEQTKNEEKEIKKVRKKNIVAKTSTNDATDTTHTPYTRISYDDGKIRCWGGTSDGMMKYHDNTWGRIGYYSNPRNKYELFACMIYQMFQSGLSWTIVLNKMPSLKEAFHNFNYHTIATYTDADVTRLMSNPDIIRNKKKIESTIHNAKLAVQLDETYPGGFPSFVYHSPCLHEDERVIPTQHHSLKSHMRTDMKTPAIERLDSDGVHPSISVQMLVDRLKQYGFQFLGPTTMLSFMQACGLVNHHKPHCFAYHECEVEYTAWKRLYDARPVVTTTTTTSVSASTLRKRQTKKRT